MVIDVIAVRRGYLEPEVVGCFRELIGWKAALRAARVLRENVGPRVEIRAVRSRGMPARILGVRL